MRSTDSLKKGELIQLTMRPEDTFLSFLMLGCINGGGGTQVPDGTLALFVETEKIGWRSYKSESSIVWIPSLSKLFWVWDYEIKEVEVPGGT